MGTNRHTTKSQIEALLATRMGNAGIPLTYLVRKSRNLWEDTDHVPSLTERRIATKMHQGNTFALDNREFFRILLNLFTSTTLDNVVKAHQPHNDGMAAWNAILANVEGENYVTELKRQGDKATVGAFFDPTKNFSIEKYFDLHVESHVLHREAGAEVPEWRKIEQFISDALNFRTITETLKTTLDTPHSPHSTIS